MPHAVHEHMWRKSFCTAPLLGKVASLQQNEARRQLFQLMLRGTARTQRDSSFLLLLIEDLRYPIHGLNLTNPRHGRCHDSGFLLKLIHEFSLSFSWRLWRWLREGETTYKVFLGSRDQKVPTTTYRFKGFTCEVHIGDVVIKEMCRNLRFGYWIILWNWFWNKSLRRRWSWSRGSSPESALEACRWCLETLR